MKPRTFPGGRRAAQRLSGRAAAAAAFATLPLAAAPLAFRPPVTYPTTSAPMQIVAADFNGDSAKDFAAVTTGLWPYGNGTVSVFLGNGDGSFRPEAAYTTGVISMGIASGDFNGDKAPDLFVVNRGPFGGASLSVLLNRGDGSGTFLTLPQIATGSQPMNAAVGLFDADAHEDVAVAVHGSSAVQILLGNGDGSFRQTPFIPAGAGANGVFVADVNNDGKADVTASNWWSYDVSVLLGNGDGTFTERLPRPAVGQRSWNLAADDLDGDGKQDLVVPNALDNSISILPGNGDGTFRLQQVIYPGGSIYNLNLADMDADGFTDIVAAADGMRILGGNGDGTFKAPQVFPPAMSGQCTAVADFDGDGAADVVAGNWTANSVSVSLQIPPNRNPVANAGEDRTAECTGALTLVQLNGSASSDPDGDGLGYLWTAAAGAGALFDDPTSPTPTGAFPLGSTLVTLTVSDGKGGFDTDDVLVLIRDTTAPVVVCTTDLARLWPANHRMVDVGITLGAADACTDGKNLVVSCLVSSSEPDDANGDGKSTGDVNGSDGYAAPVPVSLTYDPALGMFAGKVSLRAERSGQREGRTYSITCEVTDASGNRSTASCVVVVPHDLRRIK